MKYFSNKKFIYWTGLLIGLLSVILSLYGNPRNGGICVSCFMENTAGALGLHSNPFMQYIRPELLGFLLGATVSALFSKNFKARGTNAPMAPFIIGIFLIVGSAVFIGCPIRLFARFAAGDTTTIAALVGLIVGIYIGIIYLKNGFTFGDAKETAALSAWIMPAIAVMLTFFLFYEPNFISFSQKGSASMRAPKIFSYIVGLALGVLAQRSRFCVTGSIRDSFLTKSIKNSLGLIYLIVGAAIIPIMLFGLNGENHYFSMNAQPGSHPDHLWSFLGMVLVGIGSVMIGGCPFRQIIRSGEGDIDSSMAVFGMLIGGALVQTFDIASSTQGVTFNGKLAVIFGFIVIILFGLAYREKE